MYRAYRFRMYPTISQFKLIQKKFGCNRFAYNHYLEKKESLFLFCCDKRFKNLYTDYPF